MGMVDAVMGKAGRMICAVLVILSIAVTCLASYYMLIGSERIARVLGVTGLSVMNRVIGLIIGAIAVQFMFDGIRDTFPRLAGCVAPSPLRCLGAPPALCRRRQGGASSPRA